jgi:hypothetical protein
MHGTDDVRRRIRGLREQARAEAEVAVMECAEAVAAQARADCPVKSGRLRDSIRVEMVRGDGGDVVAARVVADAPYAAEVELGLGQAPQPFLGSSWERLGPMVLRELLRRLLRGQD